MLDPRSKLAAALSLTGLMVASSRWEVLAGGLAVLVGAALFLGLHHPWLKMIKALGVALLAFFLVAWVFFDLSAASMAALRLLNISSVFFLFFQTTSPEALSNGLIKWGIPYAFAFVLSASMQFVDLLIRRAVLIRDAQRARGIPLEGVWGTLRYFPALAGPLLIQAFKFADELAEALEARGFGAPGRRFRQEPRFGWPDWLVVAGSVAGPIIFFWFDLR
jgi:energy-coupling factor transport system permease protein